MSQYKAKINEVEWCIEADSLLKAIDMCDHLSHLPDKLKIASYDLREVYEEISKT